LAADSHLRRRRKELVRCYRDPQGSWVGCCQPRVGTRRTGHCPRRNRPKWPAASTQTVLSVVSSLLPVVVRTMGTNCSGLRTPSARRRSHRKSTARRELSSPAKEATLSKASPACRHKLHACKLHKCKFQKGAENRGKPEAAVDARSCSGAPRSAPRRQCGMRGARGGRTDSSSRMSTAQKLSRWFRRRCREEPQRVHDGWQAPVLRGARPCPHGPCAEPQDGARAAAQGRVAAGW